MKLVKSRIRFMSLAFDPNRFGPHYKVVCSLTTQPWYHIYSSITRTWKSVTRTLNGYMFDKGVYWNGSLHWIRLLPYFDIENETFKNMPGPLGFLGWRNHDHFGESCDRLNYARLLKDHSGVDVYELKRDYSEWVFKYHVELEFPFTSVLTVIHGVEEDDSFLVLKTGEVIVRYNLDSNTSEELPVLLTYGDIDRVFQYIESRCSVG